MVIFNIPLNCDEDGVRGFLMNDIGLMVVDIKLVCCKLNLNGCRLDVCSIDDAVRENAWDRTIVLLNLDP